MPIAIEPITTFQDLDDGPGTLAAAHDGLVPQWSDAAQRFVMVRLPAPSQVHVAGGGGGGLVQLRDMLDVQGQPGPATDGFAYLYNATVDKFILSEVSIAGETPASILAKLLTVDGAGSTLDADTLDGNDSTAFATAGHGHALIDLTDVDITPGAGVDGYSVVYDDGSGNFILSDVTGGGGYTNEQAQDAVGGILTDTATIDFTYDDAGNAITADVKDGSITATKLADGAALAEILDDDGAGSGLDADLLDGNEATAFAAASHTHPSSEVTDFTEAAQDAVGGMIADTATIDFTYTDATPELKADVKDGSITATKLADGAALAEILDDDGTGSGLDADMLDGSHASAFESAGAAAAAIATHVGEADPHTQYLLESGYTAADVLAKLLTVDGPASTLDADTLDGNDSAAFATAAHTHEVDQRADMFSDVEGDPANVGGAAVDGTSTYAARRDHAHTIGAGVITSTMLQDGAALAEILDDDGAGSLLDADLLDGQHATAFAAASHTHPSTDVTDFTEAAQDAVGAMVADTATIDFTYTDATPELKADVKTDSIDNTFLANMAQATVKGRADAAGTGDPTDLSATQLLTIVKTVDGTGSGLDADLLDGNEATAFAAASHVHAGEDITTGTVADARIASTITRDSEVFGIVLAADGAGSGLDADVLDGQSGAHYLDRANHTGTQAASTISDFAEVAQDAIGAMIADTATIDLTYTDATPELKADVKDGSITYAKIQAVSGADRLLGRDTAGTGSIEEITLGASLEFSGSQTIQRAALTGDVTASANSNSTTIANDAVSNAKLANMATKTYKGRTSAGTGDPEDVAAATVAADIQASVDHGSIAGLGDDDHTQYLLATGTREGATSQAQKFTYPGIAPWWDAPLDDATNGNHFNDNAHAIPSGWSEIDAGNTTPAYGTDYKIGFWRINGSSSVTSWKYRKQTGITLESLSTGTFQSFLAGPLLLRDGAYSADIHYKFGIYRDNSGIDETTYIRTYIWWDSATGLWKARGERAIAGAAVTGSWYTLPQGPLIQPIFVRLVLRYPASGTKLARAYIGSTYFPTSHFLMLDNNVGTGTMGHVWWQFEMSRGAGVEDYTLIGGIDLSNDP